MTTRNRLIGYFTVLLLLIAIAILAISVLRQSQLDESSREFAIYVTPLILNGNPRYQDEEDAEDAVQAAEPPSVADILESVAHPVLLQQQTSAERTKSILSVTRRLGVLEIMRNISGNSDVPLLIFSDQTPSASYELDVDFARGTAQVEIDMLHEQGEWLISAFSVDSKLLSD